MDTGTMPAISTGAKQGPHGASAHSAHSQTTKVLHLSLLVLVVHQLINSQFTSRPTAGTPLDLITTIHEYVGLASMAVVSMFWIWVLIRQRETPVGRLFPWFSIRRIGDVLTDVKSQFRSLSRREMPSDEDSAFASAIHGLGILVVTFMATTGAVYFFVAGPLARSFLSLHKLSANFMWAYLIAHAGLAALHHLAGSDIFSRMFWNKPRLTHDKTAVLFKG